MDGKLREVHNLELIYELFTVYVLPIVYSHVTLTSRDQSYHIECIVNIHLSVKIWIILLLSYLEILTNNSYVPSQISNNSLYAYPTILFLCFSNMIRQYCKSHLFFLDYSIFMLTIFKKGIFNCCLLYCYTFTSQHFSINQPKCIASEFLKCLVPLNIFNIVASTASNNILKIILYVR